MRETHEAVKVGAGSVYQRERDDGSCKRDLPGEIAGLDIGHTESKVVQGRSGNNDIIFHDCTRY